MDPYRTPSRLPLPGVDLIDPEAVKSRAWVPPTRSTAPTGPARPVLPSQAVVFRAGPPELAGAAPMYDCDAQGSARTERRRARTRRRLAIGAVAVAGTVGAAAGVVATGLLPFFS